MSLQKMFLIMSLVLMPSSLVYAQDITSEEEQFLEEEFKAPNEAPYTNETEPPTPAPTPQSAYKPYNYTPPPTIKYEQSGLTKVTAKGEYIYDVNTSPQTWNAKFRVGPFAPPLLVNTLDSGDEITFEEIYSDADNLLFTLDVEYQFISKLGKMGIKLGTGFYSASGNGRFERDPTVEAREEYTFYLFPNNLNLIYHLDYFKNQFLVPYVYGGGYYFTFLETRDDNDPMKYGGALAANFGGGVAFMLDALDKKAINQMDAEYGINHVYIFADYEKIIGLNDNFDFSNDVITGGVMVEF